MYLWTKSASDQHDSESTLETCRLCIPCHTLLVYNDSNNSHGHDHTQQHVTTMVWCVFLLIRINTWEWQPDTASKLQEWLGHSSSSQTPLAEGFAEEGLLPLQPSQPSQDGPSQDDPSESHTSAATQSLQPEDCSSSSPHSAGLYHCVDLCYGIITEANALTKPAWRELICIASG